MLLHVVAFSFSSPQGMPIGSSRKRRLGPRQECRGLWWGGGKSECNCQSRKMKWGRKEARSGKGEPQTEMQIWQSLRQPSIKLRSRDGQVEESHTGWAEMARSWCPHHSVTGWGLQGGAWPQFQSWNGSWRHCDWKLSVSCAPSGWVTCSFLKGDPSGTSVEAGLWWINSND